MRNDDSNRALNEAQKAQLKGLRDGSIKIKKFSKKDQLLEVLEKQLKSFNDKVKELVLPTDCTGISHICKTYVGEYNDQIRQFRRKLQNQIKIVRESSDFAGMPPEKISQVCNSVQSLVADNMMQSSAFGYISFYLEKASLYMDSNQRKALDITSRLKSFQELKVSMGQDMQHWRMSDGMILDKIVLFIKSMPSMVKNFLLSLPSQIKNAWSKSERAEGGKHPLPIVLNDGGVARPCSSSQIGQVDVALAETREVSKESAVSPRADSQGMHK